MGVQQAALCWEIDALRSPGDTDQLLRECKDFAGITVLFLSQVLAQYIQNSHRQWQVTWT